jgi:hypothetical protein
MLSYPKIAIAVGLIVFAQLLSAQSNVSLISSGETESWRSDLTVHLIGYAGAPKGESGAIEITPRELVFLDGKANVRLDRRQVVAAVADDERRETGGTAGKMSSII